MSASRRLADSRYAPRAEVAGSLTNVRFGGTPTALPAAVLGRMRNGGSEGFGDGPLSKDIALDQTSSVQLQSSWVSGTARCRATVYTSRRWLTSSASEPVSAGG
jgi:hypothetical protein